MVYTTQNYWVLWNLSIVRNSNELEEKAFIKLDMFTSSSEGERRHVLRWAP
jgi:hypothetical protein